MGASSASRAPQRLFQMPVPVRNFLAAGCVPAIAQLSLHQNSIAAPNGAGVVGGGSKWEMTKCLQCPSGETPCWVTAHLQPHHRDTRTHSHPRRAPGLPPSGRRGQGNTDGRQGFGMMRGRV